MGTYYPNLLESRILNDYRVDQSGIADGDVVDWNKTLQIILATQIGYDGKDTAASAYKLQWRNVTDSGSFADVSSTGEVKWATSSSSLVDGTALTSGNAKCTNRTADMTWQNGLESVGDNVLPDAGTFDLGSDCYTEFQWALSLADAHSGDQYEFQLYNTTEGAVTGVCLAQITIAAAYLYKGIHRKPRYGTRINPHHTLSQNLVGCWIFNEPGGPKAFDSARNNHADLINSAKWFGKGLDLSAANNAAAEIGRPDLLKFTSENFSIVVWYHLPSTAATTYTRMVVRGDHSVGFGYYFSVNIGGMRIEYGQQSSTGWGGRNTGNDSIAALGRDYMFGVYKASSTDIRLFVDGVDRTSVAATNPGDITWSSDKDMQIGCRDGYTDGLEGQVYAVMIWNRALTAAEMYSLYADPYQMFESHLKPPIYFGDVISYKDFSGTASLTTATQDAILGKYSNYEGTAALVTVTQDAALGKYSNFEGTAALVSVTQDAEFGVYANYTGTAALVSVTQDANLGMAKGFSGTVAMQTATQDAALGKYSNFEGTAALVSATQDASLDRYSNYAGTAAIASSTQDAEFGVYANYAGTAAMVTSTQDAALELYANYAGTASLVTTTQDAALGAYANFAGIATLTTATQDADLNRYANYTGTVTMATYTPDATLSVVGGYQDFTGAAAMQTATQDAVLGVYVNFVGVAAMATATQDAALDIYVNFTGAVNMVTNTQDAAIGRNVNFAGTVGMVTSTPDAGLSRYANYTGASAMASATQDAAISAYVNFAGTAALATSTADADLERYPNFAGTAAMQTLTGDADLMRYADFTGTANLVTNTPNADLMRYANYTGIVAMQTNCPNCELSIVGEEYKDFSGTAAMQTSTATADINKYANFAGAANMITTTSTPNLGMLGEEGRGSKLLGGRRWRK